MISARNKKRREYEVVYFLFYASIDTTKHTHTNITRFFLSFDFYTFFFATLQSSERMSHHEKYLIIWGTYLNLRYHWISTLITEHINSEGEDYSAPSLIHRQAPYRWFAVVFSFDSLVLQHSILLWNCDEKWKRNQIFTIVVCHVHARISRRTDKKNKETTVENAKLANSTIASRSRVSFQDTHI